jgi:HPt (histidine-containing phosphotransfer) domain-containing protein
VFNGLKEMMGDDFIGELVDTYLQDSPELFQQMHQALDAQDAESFRRAAHSLKSNSANFGAMQLSALARELEMMGRENRLGQAGETLVKAEKEYAQVEQALEALKNGA